MNSVIYLVGLVVVVMLILSALGFGKGSHNGTGSSRSRHACRLQLCRMGVVIAGAIIRCWLYSCF